MNLSSHYSKEWCVKRTAHQRDIKGCFSPGRVKRTSCITHMGHVDNVSGRALSRPRILIGQKSMLALDTA